MQIHTLLVSVNRLDNMNDGAVLAFERDVGLLDQGDALVARMTDGTEQLLIVEQANVDAWIVTRTVSGAMQQLRLESLDARRLRVTCETSHSAVIGAA